jgi:hypothetical protein
MTNSNKLLKFAGYGVFAGKIEEIMKYATETLPGIIEIATQAEVNAGTDDLRAITPLKLAKAYIAETVSRTIYVAATGSDLTGNGSIGLPYLTIGKAISTILKVINSGVTVTISIGVGTFTMSATDLYVLSSISGAGTLTIQGTLTLVDSGFTMGTPDALDPLTYAVSGGNTATWTLNQYKFYFLKSGANYYPITGNDLTPKISIAGAFTGTEIYQAQTIVNCSISASAIISFNCNVNFTDLTFVNAASFTIISPTKPTVFQRVYFNFATLQTITFGGTNEDNCKWQVFYSSLNNVRFVVNSVSKILRFNYFFVNTNNSNISIQANYGNQQIDNCVFENVNVGTTNFNIRALSMRLKLSGNIKMINSRVAFLPLNDGLWLFDDLTNIILLNTSYLFAKSTSLDNAMVSFSGLTFAKILGIPVTRYFFDAITEFVNVVSGRNIEIKNFIYPEFEQNLSAALADNATTNVIVGNKLQNRSLIIDYTIIRGTDYEMGTLQIISDGTNLVLAESTPVGDDVGVTFAVAFSTNDLQLQCTLTSTGTAATMKYNASRVMITPLTI